MDPVESLLRSVGGKQYTDAFQKNQININTLGLLSEEDLIVLGIVEPEIRQDFLTKTSRLQLDIERPIDTTVTLEYIKLILDQTANQLHLHNCVLACATQRNDVAICAVKTEPATRCLLDHIRFLEDELNEFEKSLGFLKSKKRLSKRTVVLNITLTTVACIGIGILLKTFITK